MNKYPNLTRNLRYWNLTPEGFVFISSQLKSSSDKKITLKYYETHYSSVGRNIKILMFQRKGIPEKLEEEMVNKALSRESSCLLFNHIDFVY